VGKNGGDGEIERDVVPFFLDTAVDDGRGVGSVEVADDEFAGDTTGRIRRVPRGALGNDKSRSNLKSQLFQSIA
jgi:hypothetical protein